MKYIIFILLILTFSNINAQDISQKINDYVYTYTNTGDFSGCILIVEKGKVIYDNCFGKANHSFNISNQAQTKFKIGSVSKQFTAAAILILEQKGVLKTSDTLSKFFQNSPIAKKVTIEQLLNHTSGISDTYNIPNFNSLSCQKTNISTLSKMILNVELDFEPGTRYQYSNGGYALLAEIIERVSGIDYQEYLKKHIFEPLKMLETGHNEVNEIVSNLAVGYDPLGYKKMKVADYIDPELLKGSGSLYSTNHDLAIWINSLKNRSFLTKVSYKKFFKNYGNSYGYGISTYKSFGQPVFGHDGRISGYIADYLHYKDSDISIVILGNIQTGVADFFRRDIASIVFNKDYKSRAKIVPPSTKNNIKKKDIFGTYSFGPNFKVYVEEKDGSIQARANQGGYSELILLEDGRFFSRTLYAYIEFKADDKKSISKMVWTNNDGNSFEGVKE